MNMVLMRHCELQSKHKLEDLTVLKGSPDLLNIKNRSRSTTAYNDTYFVLWALQPFSSSDLKQSNEYFIKQPSDF